LLAENRTNVSVLEITQAADVGLGSFYNHFESKDQLFRAAVDQTLEDHGHLMDRVTEGIDDPAEVFARAFRLTGRLHRQLEGASQILLRHGPEMITSDHGLGPRALRDIKAAKKAGRFTIGDPQLALVAAGGAILALGHLLHAEPKRDAAKASDELTADLLRMFGLDASEANEICQRPLPDLEELLSTKA
jgi:AcrR family transcriptional regulator